MIRFDSISFGFDGGSLFRDFDLRIEAAGTTALMGSSGSGKSTLLRLLLGLLIPQRGQVVFQGEPLRAGSFDQLRQRTGYLIQGGGLFPHLSATDNITLMARRRGWQPSRIERRLDKLSELVQLEPKLLDRKPGQLSGGQRQRVALLRALMLDPDLLLLDEPFSALDPVIRFQLQEELKTLIGSLNKTVLLVTHDVAEAAWLADHLVLLEDGAIVQQGQFQQFRNQPASPFVEQFLAAARPLPQ
ncbi:MAG: ATP-binding cassette domain-containing protein [Immundisolibacteraceae bacterium]|nr:ATP-binding cassette domain-containing protein [Immundisolibacteraceae bacterium]